MVRLAGARLGPAGFNFEMFEQKVTLEDFSPEPRNRASSSLSLAVLVVTGVACGFEDDLASAGYGVPVFLVFDLA